MALRLFLNLRNGLIFFKSDFINMKGVHANFGFLVARCTTYINNIY